MIQHTHPFFLLHTSISDHSKTISSDIPSKNFKFTSTCPKLFDRNEMTFKNDHGPALKKFCYTGIIKIIRKKKNPHFAIHTYFSGLISSPCL